MTDDRRLADLLSDAVSDVEPRDRIAEIRERTQRRPADRRGRWYAVGGAVLATAAAVTAVAVVGSTLRDAGPIPGSDQGPDKTASSSSSIAIDPENLKALGVYYVGDTGRGPRLYREFVNVAADGDLRKQALDALQGVPGDPDYRTLWPQGSFTGGTSDPEAGIVFVQLADESLTERPAGMTEPEARLALQQVVWTMQAVFQEPLDVGFLLGEDMVDRVLGVDAGLAERGSAGEVLSQMNISYPYQGAEVTDTLVADGRNDSYEATVRWRIEDRDGDVVLEGFTTAGGCCADRLFAWETDPIDTSALEPGGYLFIASNDDPSGGTEGSGPDSDTRLFVIE